MTDYVYAQELLGLTINEANKYVKENIVYYGYQGKVERVQMETQWSYYENWLLPGTLYVEIDNDKIYKLIRMS